jgi:hypothetical protein
MRHDLYLRSVLTVIAAALVYLCVVLTPMPAARAQQPARGALRPGDSTGPGEMVIVGLRLDPGESLPVQVRAPVTVTGDVRVSGRVQTEQADGQVDRMVLAGWEDVGRQPGAPRGQIQRLSEALGRALPVKPITK